LSLAPSRRAWFQGENGCHPARHKEIGDAVFFRGVSMQTRPGLRSGADEIANREIASEIYSVSGQFDLMAKFYIEDDVDIGRFVADNIHTVPGVERTHTILTFKAF
jgi:DNA-binding Lrp family transcriptional regulator